MEEEKSGEMEVQVCPHCLAGNPVRAHRCRACLTPFSSFAATDPVMSIAAEADTFGKAASSLTKPIMLMGIWLIMGPIAAFCVLVVVTFMLAMWRDETTVRGLVALPVEGVFGFISIGLLIKTTRNYGRQKEGGTREGPAAEGEDVEAVHRELEEGEEWKAEEEPR
jgi:hypothetical protein